MTFFAVVAIFVAQMVVVNTRKNVHNEQSGEQEDYEKRVIGRTGK